MKKKLYRIELFEKGGLAQDIAVLAALSNGGKYIPLEDLAMIGKSDIIRYPSLNTDVSINLIGEHNFTIDRGTQNLLAITEVEVMELEKPQLSNQEAKDILDEIYPTLNRQGIKDDTNHELLN